MVVANEILRAQKELSSKEKAEPEIQPDRNKPQQAQLLESCTRFIRLNRSRTNPV